MMSTSETSWYVVRIHFGFKEEFPYSEIDAYPFIFGICLNSIHQMESWIQLCSSNKLLGSSHPKFEHFKELE